MPRPKRKRQPWTAAVTVSAHMILRGRRLTKEQTEARKAWRLDRDRRKRLEMQGADKTPAAARQKRAAKDRPTRAADGSLITALAVIEKPKRKVKKEDA